MQSVQLDQNTLRCSAARTIPLPPSVRLPLLPGLSFAKPVLVPHTALPQ